jgi:hypothetical protein
VKRLVQFPDKGEGKMNLEVGSLVKVKVYGGSESILKIVEVGKNHVYLCTSEEWARAKELNIEPNSVGFLKEFIVCGKN